jgi:phosphatidylglycerophosphate synthase
MGLLLQILLLGSLAATTGLGAGGWAAGLTVGLGTCALLSLAGAGTRREVGTFAWAFGPADWVTLVRVTLVGCVTALTVEVGPARNRVDEPVSALVAIATLALILDFVDGLVARHTGSVTRQGGRFDMEVDAFLILVLSIHASSQLGPWVLAIGLMRYAYWGAGAALPWLRRPVPPRYWRKVVAAIQGVTLTVTAADLLPPALATTAVACALALLIESFGRDIAWQWRRRARRIGVPIASRRQP